MKEQIKARKAALRQRSKQEVFNIYCSKCLGRIHCADIKEMRKDWMIEDIVTVEFNLGGKK